MVKEWMPNSYQEALEIMDKFDTIIMAGGTDLMVKYRSWANMLPTFHKDVIYIRNLNELDYIKCEGEELHIGANASLETILHHEKTPQILREAIYNMASPGIRNSATLAGNIGNASPAGDSLPALYVLEAKIVLDCLQGSREVPICDFIKGPGKIDKKSNEIIREIILKDIPTSHHKFVKVGGRKTDAISKLSFVGIAQIVYGQVIDFRCAFGAVGPTVVRNKDLEMSIIGKNLEEFLSDKNKILDDYSNLIQPIDDQRSNREYRKQACINLLEDFITSIKTSG